MVKADLSRDYYGDLELPPNADVADIKKQFKKLALTYHPDRNPGRESEVTAKFQKIQSAHEVLIDPTERAKYDANRIRVSSSSFRNTYSGGQASGVRGNPWANAGAQWAPPPKPPTARNRAQPPPPSTGAGRYAKFTPPNASAYQAAQEGPQARKAQYEAWDRTRHQNQTEHGPGKTWKAPQPPPRGTPTSGRQESNAQSQTRPPRSQPGFDEFRDSTSSHGRSQSTNASNRKGFMPNTPGGDEPPAPRGAYSTQRDKPTVAPEPPPRRPPPATTENPRPSTGRTDPLKKFRMDPPTMEERVSTPYATHGGEKFNPFESAAAGINRSKSTRERSEGFGKDNFPRAGSDTNLKSKNGTPHRARSFADRKSHAPRPSYSESLDTDSSSDEPIQMNRPTPRASARRSNGASPRTTKQAGSTTDPETQTTSKQSRIQQMRQWMKENPGQEPPPNGFGADGPPLRSGQPTPKANGEPSMYASPSFTTPSHCPTPTSFDSRRPSSYSVKFETFSEKLAAASPLRATAYPPATSVKYPDLSSATPATPPSGVPASPDSLNAFEQMQRSHLDRLLSNKRQASLDDQYKTPNEKAPKTNAGSHSRLSMNDVKQDDWTQYRDPSTEPGSPSKKFKTLRHLQANHTYDFQKRRLFWDHHLHMKSEANRANTSFSFNLNNDSFTKTQPPKTNGFSNSAENISTKFTPEDWDGKFEAGGTYFQPEKVSSTPQRPRSQSNSRARGRSPIKVQPMFSMPSRSEEQTPIESPGGTKFSAQDWAETFKPQTFMPPPMTPRTGPARKRSLKPTMGGNAAVVDDGDSSDEKPLFTGRKSASPPKASPPIIGSPEPMDVDTPPVSNTVPQFAKPNGKLNTEHLKRPAASASASPVDSELKVAFEDLKVKDIISTLAMPTPPLGPSPPVTDKDIPSRAAYDDYLHRYEKYMQEWDRFNAKFLLHMVARKNQNDDLKDKRWADDKGLETYRMGLKEDQAVMLKWAEHTTVHEAVVKCFVIMKERMQNGDVAADSRRPRKKTH
ncbi:uncharacterized protein LY89DRAFT_63797 [Mollisia scopiformis]|uniref:J domain-containing protein n=1 Tax=Mollisia scopiformis TaxID=149040 RepID=A0A194X9A3_MOLSC|nr:uncharacterized protein LY89DRAFT_63797 [Mollisia scopiformis]KUJ16751.1 hypothetical protein LY89DRAFT_63797 [Mollisia scopiformis]